MSENRTPASQKRAPGAVLPPVLPPVRDYAAEGERAALPTISITQYYADSTPLPAGWTIHTLTPSVPGAAPRFEAHRGGVRHIAGPNRSDVERAVAELDQVDQVDQVMNRELVDTTYETGDPLPDGWTIATVLPPEGVEGGNKFYIGAYRGKRVVQSGKRDNVERHIRDGVTPRSPRPRGDTRYVTFESGYPLPEGWLIRYHADRGEYVGYLGERSRFFASTRDEAERRIRFIERVEARKRWDAENAATEAVASARSAVEETTKATEEYRAIRRRERLWMIVGAAVGLIVGGAGVGLVAANQAPETVNQQVTPASCWGALTDSDAVIEAYRDRIRAQSITDTGPRLEALAEAAADAETAITAYEGSKAACLEFQP